MRSPMTKTRTLEKRSTQAAKRDGFFTGSPKKTEYGSLKTLSAHCGCLSLADYEQRSWHSQRSSGPSARRCSPWIAGLRVSIPESAAADRRVQAAGRGDRNRISGLPFRGVCAAPPGQETRG